MKHILMLATGGTIASRDTGEGLAPAITSREILGYVPAIGELCRVETIQLMNLDSSNLGPRHWLQMARAIEERYDQYDGFVVTHGTDTMAYTAAALSYLIQFSPKPIVLTGSQKSICLENTDARMNLYNAFLYAAAEGSRGVSLVFDGKVILGTRAVKTHSSQLHAFESINAPQVGTVTAAGDYVRGAHPRSYCIFACPSDGGPLLGKAECILEHHRRRQDRCRGICHSFSCDIRRRTMARFIQAEFPFI